MTYLCCYLPWWIELHPGIEVALPADPSLAGRFGFWSEGSDEGAAPEPLLDFYRETRHGNGVHGFNAFITFAFRFFEFCKAHAPKLRLARDEFINPVTPEFDRKLVRGVQKTNKVPIPTPVLPLLFRYAYACESFFVALTERSLSNELSATDIKLIRSKVYASDMYAPSDHGLEVEFECQGRRYVLPAVPQLATWEERLVRLDGQDARKVLLPHLTCLRMCIVALETGIRFQGIQWLCRKTFRSLIVPGMEQAELKPLLVNTDKVRDRPWNTLIARRAYDTLVREATFQELMADGFLDQPVQYEKREHTRFAPVYPLFRGPSHEYPVQNSSYATVWERLLITFSNWYRQAHPEAEPLGMHRFVPDIDPMTSKPRVVMHVSGEESRPCCPIKVRLRHTPHSARATFVSARSGVLPPEITGALVGHTNVSSTYHYTVESQQEIESRILAAANMLWEPDPANPVHIRADGVNSALRKSFQADRAKTEAAFGLQALSLLNEEATGADGVMRLRSTPMAQVVFRETHICPVGEVCPSDVMDVLVEPRRCGVCPLAVKSVDHLPSIGAKMRRLLEQVQEGGRLMERLRAKAEPAATLDEVQHRRRLDVMEYEGWRTSLLALTKSLDELGHASADLFHVGKPDAVRLHLKLVTRDVGAAEFILHRLNDASGHPGFETPLLQAQARQLRQRLLASMRAIEDEIDLYEDDPVQALVSGLRVHLKARGVPPTFAAALEAIRTGLSIAAPGGSPRLAPPSEG